MNTTIYHFDPITREYLGHSEADESPLEPGVLLLPAYATRQAPPPTGEREAAVYDTDANDWLVMRDVRAIDLYSVQDGSPVAVADLGPQPPDTTDQPRPTPFHEWNGFLWTPNLERIKADKWEAIKAERDRRKTGGVKVGAKWFHSDDGSRIQQMGLVMMGASIPANLQWKTMDGSFITMTQTLASQVFQAVAASDQAIFSAAETHRAAMEASTDPASYDYSTGWPKIYGE